MSASVNMTTKSSNPNVSELMAQIVHPLSDSQYRCIMNLINNLPDKEEENSVQESTQELAAVSEVAQETKTPSTELRRNPNRSTRRRPVKFQDEVYVKGSGVVGCDHYDHSYDRGHFSNSWKDLRQKMDDEDYSRYLKKALAAEEASNLMRLPNELQRELQKLLVSPSIYQNDVNFIAPDTTPDTVELSSDEKEWESGCETSEDEYDSDDWE